MSAGRTNPYVRLVDLDPHDYDSVENFMAPTSSSSISPQRQSRDFDSHEDDYEQYLNDSSKTQTSIGGEKTTIEMDGVSNPSNTDVDTDSITTVSTDTLATRHRSALPECISWRVAHSWEKIQDNLEPVGVKFFLTLFAERPELLDLFRFSGLDLSKGEVPTPLKRHALVVMQVLGECVSGNVKLEDIVPKLRAIGQVHAASGVQNIHYDVMFDLLMSTISQELGPDAWDGELRDAWELVYRSLTGVMKHPNDLLELEPLEGWGVVNAMACAYIAFFTPFMMAGFTARSAWIEFTSMCFTTLAAGVLSIDMSSQWIANRLRERRWTRRQGPYKYNPDATTMVNGITWARFKLNQVLIPAEYHTKKFLRGLKMERWSNWKFMDATVVISFVLQYLPFWIDVIRRGPTVAWSVPIVAGVHWTYAFGLLRLVAGSRVWHFITCAENNLMLRRRMSSEEKHYIRIFRLTMVMSVVIHTSACLWVIISRIELGRNAMNPQPTPFFPNPDLHLGKSGWMNCYLHAVHWAWVNLAGIGNIESVPETSLECLTTLFIHICGATLYTVITGNVVNILDVITQRQLPVGNDLAEIGELISECHVPPRDQERILQSYMMNHMVHRRGGGSHDNSDGDNNSFAVPQIPEAISRLPHYIREEVLGYVRAEAIKRRDPAFVHTSNEFIFAILGALNSKSILMAGDYYVKESRTIPHRVAFIEKGTTEEISNGKCVRTLQQGAIIGKRWLLSASQEECTDEDGEVENTRSGFPTSLRAYTNTTLIIGLSDPQDIQDLHSRFETDFGLLKMDRALVHSRRKAKSNWRRGFRKMAAVAACSNASAGADTPSSTSANAFSFDGQNSLSMTNQVDCVPQDVHRKTE